MLLFIVNVSKNLNKFQKSKVFNVNLLKLQVISYEIKKNYSA